MPKFFERLVYKFIHFKNCIIQMSKKVQSIEHELLGSLLDDQDQKQSQRVHLPSSSEKRMNAYSAPPALFDIGFKIDDNFLDQEQYDTPQSADFNFLNEFSNEVRPKQKNNQPNTHPGNFRKFSYQPIQIHPFQTYQPVPVSLSPLTYYSIPSIFSPEQELLANLNQIGHWAKDQHGSRTVQNIFQNGSDENKDLVFQAIYNEAMTLIMDKFGNYVFQKVFENGLEIHKIQLFGLLQDNFIELSFHPYGCRVIQKAIDYLKNKPQAQQFLLQQISQNYKQLIENQNGNHVIQKCFDVFPSNLVDDLAVVLIENLQQLAFHAFGCRVIQKYLQTNRQTQKCQIIMKKLLQMSIKLSQCQYGNYVMQHIVTKCCQESEKVLKKFLQNILKLSTNKYASNVIEKAIKANNSSFREKLSEWFIENGEKQLIQLSKHQFGNYVVQSLLDKASKNKKDSLKVLLKENMTEISKSQYGRHVLMQLQKGKFK